MSMTSLNVIQFLELFIGYFVFTVGIPALVFYRKTKGFPMAERFLIYFTVGNFYIINLVQVLQLLHISHRITLFLFTIVPAGFAIVKINSLSPAAYIKNLASELRHYNSKQLGPKTFLRHRWREVKVFLQFIWRNVLRIVKESLPDIPFFLLFALLIWKICGNGILYNWGFGASDIPVHNYWINGLIDNNIFIDGIYPMGMHCMLYYLAEILGIPVYVTLRLFWLVQYIFIVLAMLCFLKGLCKNRFVPYIAVFFFVGAKYFVNISYSRYGATLPQEFGMLYILPSIFFIMKFFKARESELNDGFNLIKCNSTMYLLGFALSFSLTLASHFYDTIVAGIICVGIAMGYGYLLFRKEYFGRVMLSGIISILLAFLPMAAALLMGKTLQGSMYWAMSIIGLRDYTVLIFRIICIGVVAVTAMGILLTVRGIKKGKISFENKKVPKHSVLNKAVLQLFSIIPLLLVIALGWKYRATIILGTAQTALSLPNMKWLLYITFAVLTVAVLCRYVFDKQKGMGILSLLAAEIIMGLILVSGNLNWPILMEPYRICIYFAYIMPVIAVMTLDGLLDILLCGPIKRVRQPVGALLLSAVIVCGVRFDLVKEAFGGGSLEMNEAILCTTNIIHDNKGLGNKWTIVSANDELRMVEKYGRHTETIEFLEDMENWNPSKELTIPTEKVYFYIEKKPLNYANGYSGAIPPVSPEQASKELPENSGISAYNGQRRSVTMSRMYYWAKEFEKLYPNEFKVYYETDRFVCYYIEQNVYSLYNFAIDYGYNL